MEEEEKKTCPSCGVELAEGEEHTCAQPEGESKESGGESPVEGGDQPAEGGEEQKTE